MVAAGFSPCEPLHKPMSKTFSQPHRLHKDVYLGETCSFTCCIKNRAALFRKKEIVEQFTQLLIEATEKHHCEIVIALFMPDHLHTLLQAKNHSSNPLKAMNLFKQTSGYWMSQNETNEKWQKSFYDHILRKDEDVIKHVIYILGNPVRAGLVENWKLHPYKHSTILNFDSLEI